MMNHANVLITYLNKVGDEKSAKFFESHLDELNLILKNSTGVRIRFEEFVQEFDSFMQDSQLRHEPLLARNLLHLLNYFYLSAIEIKDQLGEEVITAFKSTIDWHIERVIHLCKSQIDCLISVVKNVVDRVEMYRNANIHLLEIPVGNSIPVKLIEELFKRKGIEYKLIKVRLNRNDKKSLGMTREEILKKGLEDGPEKLVIYMDEWMSGTNFNVILNILNSIQNIKIFPYALLAHESSKNQKFNKYVNTHELVCRKIGLPSEEMRTVFPKLNSKHIADDQIFFWSEMSKLAGYNKLNLFGSIISTLNNTVENLLHYETFIQERFERMFRLNQSITILQFKNVLEESVQYYNENIKHKLLAIEVKSNTKNMESMVDIEAEAKLIQDQITFLTANTDADIAVKLSQEYMQLNIRVPVDRYSNIGHIPIIYEVPKEEKELHNLFLTKLYKLL